MAVFMDLSYLTQDDFILILFIWLQMSLLLTEKYSIV